MHGALSRPRVVPALHQLTHHSQRGLCPTVRRHHTQRVSATSNPLPAVPQVVRRMQEKLGLQESKNTFALYEQNALWEQPVSGSALIADILTRSVSLHVSGATSSPTSTAPFAFITHSPPSSHAERYPVSSFPCWETSLSEADVIELYGAKSQM